MHKNEDKYGYDQIKKKIVNKVEEFPPILEEWLLSKMTWDDIKSDAILIAGQQIEFADWKNIKITILR